MADGNAGLVTIDISDPTAPVRVDAWSIPTSGTALKTVSMGEYVFVAEDKGGAAAYRLSDDDPFTPTPYDPPGSGGSGCFIGSIRWPQTCLERWIIPRQTSWMQTRGNRLLTASALVTNGEGNARQRRQSPRGKERLQTLWSYWGRIVFSGCFWQSKPIGLDSGHRAMQCCIS